MSEPGVKTTRRKLPHWTLDGSTYFVTFTLKQGKLTAAERSIVLRQVILGDGLFYSLVAATVMEDHVHVILAPRQGIRLDRITKGIKGVSAKAINRSRGVTGSLWLAESYDRIIRDQRELDEKLRYMLNNAPKKAVVEDGWAYCWWHFNERSVLMGDAPEGTQKAKANRQECLFYPTSLPAEDR